jgi:tetratricopeptide (TPR) repeat protein
MRKKILFALLITLSLSVFSQSKKEEININELKKDTLLTEYKYLLKDQNFKIEKIQTELLHKQEKEELNIQHLETRINAKIEKLDSKYNYYLIFGGLLLAILVFFINYFGRNYIKEKVEVLIEKTATQYAEMKTDDVLKSYINDGGIDKIIKEKGEPAIEQIIVEIQKKGTSIIDGIKEKGEKAISSMLAKQGNPIDDEKDLTTEEGIINANKDSRVKEFFELAFTRKDPLIQIELYKNVLEIEPENIEALNNIGVSFNNAYNYSEAIKYLTKCIKIKPSYALAYANLANSYNLLEDLEKSLEYTNKAIELDSKVDYSYSVKGNVLTKKGELEEAEKTFNRAIELNPNSPEAYFTRGFFYEETGKYDESEKDYKKADELGFPNKAMLYNNYAVLYRRKSDFDKAIKYLEMARIENPNFKNIDGTLALIYADKKDTENFYKHLIIALDKGCPAWNYINDPGFDGYRDEEKLQRLLSSYKKKYVA